ncbi:MAG: hypothetical protein HY316_09895 [Acidobacteria bacterium]|nr:hypothetical protein [Acidobacteriota bacterium]
MLVDDARRFLRFIAPGALFGLETAVLLLLLRPDWFLSRLAELKNANGLGFAVAGLLASGGLGFLFSAIHHEVHWSWESVFDHSGLIRGLIEAQQLHVLVLTPSGVENPLSSKDVTREKALAVVGAMWHGRSDQPPIKGADVRVVALSDIAHSAGIARIASFFALATAIITASCVSQFSPHLWPFVRFVIAVALGVASIWLFGRTYRRVGSLSQAVIEQVLLASLTSLMGTDGGLTRTVIHINESLPKKAQHKDGAYG